jgi:ankyrin repeat protein
MLTEASQNGHYDIVKLLIENNANINFKNEMGCSALHLGKLNMKYSV